MPTSKEELFQEFAMHIEVTPSEHCYINWLGIETDSRLFGNGASIVGKVLADLPLGHLGDNVYGSSGEYASLLSALKAAEPRNEFTIVELGAGWGPWISAAGLAAKRLGITNVNLIGIEADRDRYLLMEQHLERNGLSKESGVHTRLLHGAAWKENTFLRFGAMSGGDHGGAVKTGDGGSDYRGIAMDFVEVPAFDLKTICDGMPIIDFMHWDVQGAELEVANSGIEMMNERVRSVFIGTHSALIDGCLLDLFFRHGWDVKSFTPCSFIYDASKSSLEAMGISDGEIVAENPRLR